MIKKICVLIPAAICFMIFTVLSINFEQLPSAEQYPFILANAIAGICLWKGYTIGVLFGIFSGVFLCYLSMSNWKTGDIEWSLGIAYVVMYVVLCIFLLFDKRHSR